MIAFAKSWLAVLLAMCAGVAGLSLVALAVDRYGAAAMVVIALILSFAVAAVLRWVK